MKEEVAAAVVFVTRLVKRNKQLSKEQSEQFADKLTDILVERFKNHWHPEQPLKGQAYRCIRINEFEPIDSVLQQAAGESGLNFKQLYLPSELTLWVDPSEVCCRFGENKGSCITVASFRKDKTDNHALTLNVDEMVNEYQKKKSEEISKLREFTGKRSPVNTPNSGHMKNGSYSISQQAKWLKNPHYNLNHRARPFYGNSSHWIRSDCVYYPQVSNYDEDVLENGENAMYSQQGRIAGNTPPLKSSTQTPVSSNKADKYHWVKESVKA